MALATQVAIETAREHGLQLNMASNKTEAVVDFRGKGRQQVLEDLALEFPVVDGQWTPTVHVADGVLLRLVSTYRHLGTQASHGTRRGPERAARRSAARAAYHATRKKILSQRRLSKKARVAVARAVVSSRLLNGAGTWHSHVGAMEDTYMAPFRTIANERWRPGHVPASSVRRRLGILDFREAVSMQRLRLAARLVNASPSLMALLQSDAGRAWKAELFCDIELLRQEQGPQLVEVESLSDFEKLWCDFPQAWKLLVSSCHRKLVERRQRSEPPLFVPVPILPTFSCDECDAVYFTLRALRSHQMKAHQRRREARRYVLGSVCPVCKADFRSRPRVIQHLEVGAKRCVLAWKLGTLVPFSDEAVAAADRLDCEHRRRCKREGRSHLAHRQC